MSKKENFAKKSGEKLDRDLLQERPMTTRLELLSIQSQAQKVGITFYGLQL